MKHIPQRTCISCRESGDKRKLYRIVRTANGAEYDPTGRANGRGAYVCGNPDCIVRMVKSRQLNRSFKCEISADCYERIREGITAVADDKD